MGAALTTQDLMTMTTYTSGRKNSRLKFTDTKELIVEWPSQIAPTTHADAAAEALRITREMAHTNRNGEMR